MPTSRFRKLLASLFVFAGLYMSAQAADYTWTGNAGDNDWNNALNWNPSTVVPGDADTVTLNNTVNITLSDNVVIGNLFIYTGNTKTVTLNLNGKKLNINTRLRLGKDVTGQLVLNGGSLSTTEFDTNDNGNNSLYLNNTNLSISNLLLANGTGTTTIDGTGSSSFTIPANYNTTYGSGNTLSFSGSIQPTVASGNYTITSSGVPAPGATITITITKQTSDTPPVPEDFSDITFQASFTGTVETYKVNGTAITNAATTISNSPAASTMTITVELPPSIEPGHGISLALYEGTTTATLLGTPLFYTQQSADTTWTGSAGNNNWNNISNWTNGIPAKNMNAIIPGGASSYPNLTSDISATNLKSVNLNATGSELTIGAGGKIKTDSLINKGTLANSGSITAGDFTNNAAINNSGNISVSKDLTSTANITGTGNLIFTGTENQVFAAGNNHYSNIQENKTGSGTLTINGSCEIDAFTITRGTETIFANTPEFTTFTNAATHTGKITFNAGAEINGNFTHTNGITQITGTLQAQAVQLGSTTKEVILSSGIIDSTSVELGSLSLAGSGNAITTTGTQSFSAIDGATDLTLDSGTSSISFNGDIGSSTALTTLEVNGAVIIASGCTGITTTTEIDFNDTINGSATLTIDSPIFKSTSTNDNSITLDEIEFAATTTSIQTNSKKLTFDVSAISGTGKTISLSSGSKAKLKAGITVSPAVTNSGLITCSGAVTFGDAVNNSSGTITCNGAATFKGAYSGTSASLTLSSGTTIFESNLDLSGTTFTHSSGTVQIGGTADSAVTVTGPVSPQRFYNFTSSRSLIIKGDNSFNDFTATGPGEKTISFEAGKTQTVNGTLALSGTSGNKLNLIPEGSGTWNIICANPATLENLSVTNSNNTTTGGVVFTATGSTDNGGNTNWAFPGQHYTWTGADTTNPTKWKEPKNWNPKSIPGKGSIIEIQAGLTDGHYPVLTDSIDIDKDDAATENGTITNNGQLDLFDYNIKAKKITNNGILKLTGAAGQEFKRTDGTTATVMENGTNSTVEYYGTGINPTNFAWDGDNGAGTAGLQYANLILAQDCSTASTTTITTSKDLTIKAGADLQGEIAITGKVIIDAGSGAVTLKSSGTITIDDNANAQSLDCDCPVKIQNITTSGNQTYRENVTLLSTATFTTTVTSSTIDFQKNILVSGTSTKKLILDSAATISNTAAIIESDLQTQTGKSFTPSSGTTTFKANVLLADSTVNATSGTVILTGENAELRGSNTFFGLELQNSAKITGSNHFASLTANSAAGTSPSGLGGKIITFTAGTTQTISGALTLMGSGASSRLQLCSSSTGSWWKISCTSSNINYVNVKDSKNESSDFLFALNSWDSGHNDIWVFPGMEYTWTGASTEAGKQNDWDTAANWTPPSVPRYGTIVYIADPANHNHPILTNTLDLNHNYNSHDYNGQITVNANAKFDLQGNTLKVGAITNNGTVRMTGVANQIQISGGGSPSNGTSVSTVEYYDAAGAATTLIDSTLAWGNNYKKIIINKAASLDSTALTVLNTTEITSGNSKDVSLNNSGNSFGDTITINARDVTLNSSSNVTIVANALANNLSVTCADDKIININNITTNGSQTFDGAVTVASNTNLTAGAGSTDLIYFKKTVTGNNTLSISTANSQFDGAVTNLPSLTTAATTTFNTNANISNVGTLSTAIANINCSSISTSGAQTYGGAVAVGTDITFTANAGQLINFQNTLTGSGSPLPQVTIQTANSQFDGAISGFTSLTTAATTTFNTNANISSVGTLSTAIANINCSSITTSGAQTYSNAVAVGADTALTSSGGNILFGSTVNGAHQIEFSVPASTGTITVTGQVGNTSAPSFVLTQAGTTTFASAVNLSSFTDTADSGTINFNNNVTISSATAFLTPAPVTFGDDAATDIFNFTNGSGNVNLTHTAGNTNITGTLNAADIVLGTTSGTTTINGTVNASQLSVGTLNVQGNITTSGSQNYNGTVTLTNDLTLESTTTTTGTGGITFASTIDGTHVLNITTNAGTNGTTFNGFVGQTAPLTTVSVNGPSTFHCTSITSTGNQTYNGTVTVQSDTTLTANAGQLIKFQNTLTGTGTPLPQVTIQTANSQFDEAISSLTSLTTAATTTFNTNANVSSVGTLSTGIADINCSSISTSGAQTYSGAIAIGTNIAFTSSGGNILFGSTVNGTHQLEFSVPASTGTITVTGQVGNTDIPSVVLTQAGTTTFASAVNLSSFTDTAASGAINFNNGGTISSATNFLTPYPVTFGDAVSDTFNFGAPSSYVNLTHETGNTNITGTLNAANIVLGTTSGTTSITGTVTGADITVGNTTGGPATITTSGIFLLTDGKTLSYTSSFTQNGTGDSVLKGDFGSASGNSTASFAHCVQLSASGAANFGTTGDSISIAENLIITASATGLTINAPVTVNENIVMYSGPVTAAADLYAQKDILILGSSYSETDTSTGITDEYSYTSHRPTGWSTGNYNAAQLPDRTSLPASNTYSATLQTHAGKTITAGKNFYANHTELTSASAGLWLLKLTDLTNPANGFAEAYFTKVKDCKVICSDGSDDGSKARLITLEDIDSDTEKTTNTNVDFDEFKITSAYTVRDNVIRVEFNRPIRYHSSVISLLKYHDSSDAVNSTTNFLGFYTNPDCIPESEITASNFPSYTNPSDGNTYYYFYIKASPQDSAAFGAWNTDATGRHSGQEKSSDRNSIHHTALPCLDFPRALAGNGSTNTIPFIFTDIWGKRLNNYSRRVPIAASAEPAYGSPDSTFEVEDKTGPVLWSVRTGQELHQTYNASTGEVSQHSYDSHNFLEFRYSEKVDVGSLTAANVPEENLQVTDSLGAIQENITQANSTLNFAGLVKFTAPAGSPLLLFTGSSGSANKYMNALYRNDEYSVRLSVAGWTDGTVTDYTGNTYKKWPGYIEAATQFTGATAHAVAPTNNLIKDLEGNEQIEYFAGYQTEPVVISNSTESDPYSLLPVTPDLYSKWDLSAPVFTPLRFSKDTEWGDPEFSEAVGNTNGTGSTLDRIDFHFFDNTPSYTASDAAEWFTEIGWCNPGSEAAKENLKDSSYTYCADIIGGARQFDSDSSRRTNGGIRMSTKLSSAPSFRYNIDADAAPDREFSNGENNVFTTVVSALFTGSSEPRRPANDPDGLYLGLKLTDLSLPIETTFSFSFNEGNGFITDLAGNRLRSKVSKTVDRSTPSFDITLSPINQKEIIIVFVKQVVTDSSKIRFTDNNGNRIRITEDFLSLLPDCFQIISINSDGTFTPSPDIQIDTAIPAQIIQERTSKSFTAFRLTLTKPVTLENIKQLYVQVKQHSNYPEFSTDPYTSNSNSRVTLIQDKLGNYIGMYSAHALSDFAVGVVNPAYGYSPDMKFEEDYVMNGLYSQGTWAVHDWNADQQNYGTLPAGHPVTIVANTDDGTEEKLALPENVRLYFSPTPQAASVSSQLNKDLNMKLRVWLPSVTDGIIPALSSTNNDNFKSVDSTLLNPNNNTEGLSFTIPLDDAKEWASGNQISFLFGILNSNHEPFRIYSSPYYDIGTNRFNLSLSDSVPLYCLRMHNTSDISTLDLWSFKIKSITDQRGGVTILNNVINADMGEKTVVKVNQPVNGRLNVIVMTLDGNIITYLHRGEALAGEHYFTWNGKNKAGNSVARGMYFIRVIGGDFDETRKVMVVK